MSTQSKWNVPFAICFRMHLNFFGVFSCRKIYLRGSNFLLFEAVNRLSHWLFGRNFGVLSRSLEGPGQCEVVKTAECLVEPLVCQANRRTMLICCRLSIPSADIQVGRYAFEITATGTQNAWELGVQSCWVTRANYSQSAKKYEVIHDG